MTKPLMTGPKLQHTVTLTPGTVTDISTGAARPQRRRRRSGRSTSTALTRITVHPQVWAAALILAEGDPLRLEVVSATEVVVKNTTRRKAAG